MDKLLPLESSNENTTQTTLMYNKSKSNQCDEEVNTILFSRLNFFSWLKEKKI
jgi:hypothetical protein